MIYLVMTVLIIYLLGVLFFGFINMISYQSSKPNPPNAWKWPYDLYKQSKE